MRIIQLPHCIGFQIIFNLNAAHCCSQSSMLLLLIVDYTDTELTIKEIEFNKSWENTTKKKNILNIEVVCLFIHMCPEYFTSSYYGLTSHH